MTGVYTVRLPNTTKLDNIITQCLTALCTICNKAVDLDTIFFPLREELPTHLLVGIQTCPPCSRASTHVVELKTRSGSHSFHSSSCGQDSWWTQCKDITHVKKTAIIYIKYIYTVDSGYNKPKYPQEKVLNKRSSLYPNCIF